MPELQKLNLSNNSNPVQPVVNVSRPQPTVTPQVKTQSASNSVNLLGPIVLVLALILGIGSGYAAFKMIIKPTSQSTTATLGTQIPSGSALKVGDVFGATDASSFKDSAEGVLEKGGINGEGSHHLLRPGGKSQTVYLTSSVVDLDQVVGHKVKVWGQTFSARKAGWLMDVGRVQIEELNAPTPSDQ